MYTASGKSDRNFLLTEHAPLVKRLAYQLKARLPPSVEVDDLVQAGYLKEVPTDPMTHSNSTWVTATSDVLESVDQSDPGINDVHSGSDEQGTNGQPYSSW